MEKPTDPCSLEIPLCLCVLLCDYYMVCIAVIVFYDDKLFLFSSFYDEINFT